MSVKDIFSVYIEIPMLSVGVKYEYDKETKSNIVDRFLSTPMHYPCNYGFIPDTLAKDGDSVDVLVVTEYPLAIGSTISTVPVGTLRMEDEKGEDYKVIAVPAPQLGSIYSSVTHYKDLPPRLISEIECFFKYYKENEKNKWTKLGVPAWLSPKETIDFINNSKE